MHISKGKEVGKHRNSNEQFNFHFHAFRTLGIRHKAQQPGIKKTETNKFTSLHSEHLDS